MASISEPYSERYSCAVVERDVIVQGHRVAILGGGFGPRPAAAARQMRGCNGAHICGLFAEPGRFQLPGHTGCPYHDSLNNG